MHDHGGASHYPVILTLSTVTACRQEVVTDPRKQQLDAGSERLLEIPFWKMAPSSLLARLYDTCLRVL